MALPNLLSVATAPGGTGYTVQPVLSMCQMWVITENPSDFPGAFVVRRFTLAKLKDGRIGNEASQECYVAKSLETVRTHVPGNLICVPRLDHDDPVIVETWTTQEGAEWLSPAAQST